MRGNARTGKLCHVYPGMPLVSGSEILAVRPQDIWKC